LFIPFRIYRPLRFEIILRIEQLLYQNK